VKQLPENQLGGSGSSVSSPVWSGAKTRPLTHFGVFLARKSHLAATFFYKRLKNSCIGKKCWNDVQKFTPTEISGGIWNFQGGISPPPHVSGRNTGKGDGVRGIVLWDGSL